MSSVFSILTAVAPAQPASAKKAAAPEPSGPDFESFLTTAQVSAEGIPSAPPGASTPLEVPEGPPPGKVRRPEPDLAPQEPSDGGLATVQVQPRTPPETGVPAPPENRPETAPAARDPHKVVRPEKALPDGPSGVRRVGAEPPPDEEKATETSVTSTSPSSWRPDETPGIPAMRGGEGGPRIEVRSAPPRRPARTTEFRTEGIQGREKDGVSDASAPVTAWPAEITASEKVHEGKSDRGSPREEVRAAERLRSDQDARFTPASGDPAPLTAPAPGPDHAASAHGQSAVSAAGSPSHGVAPGVYPEAAPHPAPPASTIPPEAVVRQVIRGARFLLKDDVSEVRVRLEHPELGSVHIRLTSDANALSGEIAVSSAEIKGIVESHLHQLRASLTEQGLHVGQLDVSVRDGQGGGAGFDRAGGFGHPGDAPGGRQNTGRHPGPEWETQEEPRRGHSQSLVDYFA